MAEETSTENTLAGVHKSMRRIAIRIEGAAAQNEHNYILTQAQYLIAILDALLGEPVPLAEEPEEVLEGEVV